MDKIGAENFHIDVEVKKLTVTNDLKLSPKDVEVDATLEKPLLPVSNSKTNLTEVENKRGQQTNQILHKQRIKLTVYKKKERNHRGEKIGECYYEWGAREQQCWADARPVEHTCEIFMKDERVGLLTVKLMLIEKCLDHTRPSAKPNTHVGIDGHLSIFNEMKDLLDPQDVFFVVGDKSCCQSQEMNPLQSCRGYNPCKTELDPNKYLPVQGKLLRDFSILPNCDNDDCCANMEDVLEEFEKLFETPEPRPPRESNEHSAESCGPESGISDLSSCSKKSTIATDSNRLSSDWEDNPCDRLCKGMKAPDCQKGKEEGESGPESKSTSTACSQRFPMDTKNRPLYVNCLVEKVLQAAKKCERKQMIHTCSAPKLIDSNFQLQPQHCPICCEDLSWVQSGAPCPKCGFKPKMKFPVQSATYDETQTAEKILERWNADVEKFKRRRDINPLGVCLCTKDKECTNCYIRRTSQKPLGDITDHITNQTPLQKEVDKFRDEQKTKDEFCNKVMASRIVKDTLSQPLPLPAMILDKLSPQQAFLPNVDQAFKWSENQCPIRKNMLDSASDASLRSRTSILNMLHEVAKKEAAEQKKIRDQQRKTYQNVRRQDENTRKSYFDECRQRAKYPPNAYGHYQCKPLRLLVPKNMGWNWHLDVGKDRFGWRPGAIRCKTRRIMDYFSQKKAAEEALALRQQEEECRRLLEKPKPVELPHLHLKKEKGQYTVTVYPLYDPNKPASELTEKMKPIEFTIDKAGSNWKRRQIRECLKRAEQHGDCFDADSFQDAKIASAIGNLRELLGYDNLRNILQSDSESDGSIDIQIGGGVPVEKKHKIEKSVQIEDDINNRLKSLVKSGKFYKDPYTGKCQDPDTIVVPPKKIPRPKPAEPSESMIIYKKKKIQSTYKPPEPEPKRERTALVSKPDLTPKAKKQDKMEDEDENAGKEEVEEPPKPKKKRPKKPPEDEEEEEKEPFVPYRPPKKPRAKTEGLKAKPVMAAEPPPIKRYRHPKKPVPLFLNDAFKLNECPPKPCRFEELCPATPLTKVRFRAHDVMKDECAWGDHPRVKSCRCPNESCYNREPDPLPKLNFMRVVP